MMIKSILSLTGSVETGNMKISTPGRGAFAAIRKHHGLLEGDNFADTAESRKPCRKVLCIVALKVLRKVPECARRIRARDRPQCARWEKHRAHLMP